MGTLTGKRIMIAGSGSGCGKTTAVCGILYGLQKQGLSVQAWKSGPDYIDPMFHKKVTGSGSGNLDLFFSGRDGVCRLLADKEKRTDIAVVEGAMGYYDGIGMTEKASCYELSMTAALPVVLVVNPAGMGQSVCAMIQGFLNYRQPNRIVGILFNQISSSRYAVLKPCVEEMGLKAVGFIPRQDIFVVKSRHLGLVTADEVAGFYEKLERFYRQIENTIDWELLSVLAGSAEPVVFPDEPVSDQKQELCIGVARDEAFCFFYEDNFRYLERMGCRVVCFSPLREKCLPDGTDGLWLCGGYPELYASGLSRNLEMRRAVRDAVRSGMPCIAECGGFLYLQESLMGETGALHEMTGVFSGHGFRKNRLERFGYIELSLQEGRLFGREQMNLRAHEFHYYDCSDPGSAFLAKKASGESRWMTGAAGDTLYAGFPHIYLEGNRAFAEGFLEQAKCYRKKRQH